MARQRPPKSRSYITKVARVRDHQPALVRLRSGDYLKVVREPSNQHDGRAIRLDSPRGKPIGYLAADQAAKYTDHIDEGRLVCVVRVLRVTGRNQPTQGVNVTVGLAPTTAEARALAAEKARRARATHRKQPPKRKGPARERVAQATTTVLFLAISLVLILILIAALLISAS
ncbi:MAG: HIRAN domain-containing protein [Planctomycetota bacterium]